MFHRALIVLFLPLSVFAQAQTKDTCWNYVVDYPNMKSAYWSSDCKGDARPSESLNCKIKQVKLTATEKKGFQAWVKAGSPQTACQKMNYDTPVKSAGGFDMRLCWENSSGFQWLDGCKGDPDPRTTLRCTAALVGFSEEEKTQYQAWEKAGKPKTPCMKRSHSAVQK